MSWKGQVAKLRGLFRRKPVDDLEDEIRTHLQMEEQENLESGMPPDEAHYAALRRFGNVPLTQERSRDMWRWNSVETLGQDLRFGLRMLRKNPGFTAIAVISLGLGIGANITIFSFVNALLFRPPAVESPSQLVEVWNQNMHRSGIEHYLPLSYPDYGYYRDHNQVFSGLSAFDGEPRMVIWSRAGQGEKAQVALVSGNFFDVLGVKPTMGRTFNPEEDQAAGALPVIVLSHAFWEQRLGSDPAVLGKTFIFNGTYFTAIGIAPAGFKGILAGIEPDFWAPIAMTTAFTRDPSFLTSRNVTWIFDAGRLKPGIAAPQAEADLTVLAQHLQHAYPESNKDKQAAIFAVNLVPGPLRGYVAAFTSILMAVVGLVLIIACANAANLLLAQANARRRETAIRAALGARRGRLILQMLVESTLIALLGGGLAFLLASWIAPALLALKPASIPFRFDVPLDWRVVAFALAASFATGIIFGAAPALRSTRTDVSSALKDESSIGGYRSSKLRSVLVVAQIAVCSVLLISAGLCVRSLLNAQSIDPGFDTQHELMALMDPGSMGYSELNGRTYYQQLVDKVKAIPGVTSASLAGYLPLTTTHMMVGAAPENGASQLQEKLPGISFADVGPGYFRTMGISLLRGREFVAQDVPTAPPVAIVNEAAAKRFWPKENPIGHRLITQTGPGPESRESLMVVGVVRTGKYRTLSEGALPFFYRSFLQNYHSSATLVVQTTGDPHSLLPAVRREIQALDPNVVPFDMETMKEYMALPLFPAHTAGLLFGAFGFLALVLAVGGLYGVMAYAVSQRTHEIGVRMALGAARPDVIRMMVGQGLMHALIGIGIGLVGALAATRVLSSLLYGISATDPVTFMGVSLLLVGVAFAASYIPARRATKIDPMVALRYE